MSTCKEGRFRGGCPTCDACSGSQSYREFDYTPDPVVNAETQAWMDWFRAHNIPAAQVPWKGWVARDVERRQVSVKVFAWLPEDETKDDFGTISVVRLDRDEDGHLVSKDVQYAVHTVQLEFVPLPFPVVVSVGVS